MYQPFRSAFLKYSPADSPDMRRVYSRLSSILPHSTVAPRYLLIRPASPEQRAPKEDRYLRFRDAYIRTVDGIDKTAAVCSLTRAT